MGLWICFPALSEHQDRTLGLYIAHFLENWIRSKCTLNSLARRGHRFCFADDGNHCMEQCWMGYEASHVLCLGSLFRQGIWQIYILLSSLDRIHSEVVLHISKRYSWDYCLGTASTWPAKIYVLIIEGLSSFSDTAKFQVFEPCRFSCNPCDMKSK